MSSGTLILLLLVIGLPLAMMFMHGAGGVGMGHGGHAGHGGHGGKDPASPDGGRQQAEHPADHAGYERAPHAGEQTPAAKKAHGCH